ncbi:hypothetical protein ACFSNO_25350 [Streptomyces cirratus]
MGTSTRGTPSSSSGPCSGKPPPALAEELTGQLADLARHAHDHEDRNGVGTLLALLDTAATATGTRAARAQAELEHGLYLLHAGLPGDSIPRFSRALELADSPGNRCRAVFHSGMAWMELGNAAEAETAFRKALALATEADDVEGLVQTATDWRRSPSGGMRPARRTRS